MLLLGEPTRATEDVVASAAGNVIEKGVLGALLIIAVVGIIFLIRRLLAVQDQRVADQVRSNELMERTREKTALLMEHVAKSSNETNTTLDRHADKIEDNTKAAGELRTELAALRSTMDSVMRDAVRSGGHSSESSSSSRHEASRAGIYSEVQKGGGGR
jgi:hypothetical protein